MRNLTKILMLVVLALAFSGCGKKDKKTSVRKSRDSRTSDDYRHSNNGVSTQAEWYGQILGFSQTGVDDFISGSNDPEETVGYMNVQGAEIRFKGRIDNDKRYRENGSNNSDIRGGSITLLIVDSVAVDSGYALELSFNNARGEIQGNSISFEVEDNYGRLIFKDARSYGGILEGEVRFVNDSHFDAGASPAQGYLGRFEVPTCEILNCD